MTTYGSVCSGIESASVAWEPLGMQPLWFSEIEPFPCAVLRHHWPAVPNLGDMLRLPGLIRAGLVPAPDILVGGTPCQAFSVAGKRGSLDDDRGQLTLTYVDILNAIDEQRPGREATCVWENVPGVLNTKDNAFGFFLGGLAGSDSELKPPGPKWGNAGYIAGSQRTIAWRTLDAQYFGVAQRRRRVFVVASARAGFDPGAVLFECEGVRRDTPPSREQGAHVAALTANGVGTCGADDNQGQAGHLMASTGDVSHCLNAGGMGRQDYETETMIAFHVNAQPDQMRFDPALSATLTASQYSGVSHTLRGEGFDASEDGTGRGTPLVSVPYGFQPRIARNGRGDMGGVVSALSAQAGKGDSAPCVAHTVRTEKQLTSGGKPGQRRPVIVRYTPTVRRLTPTECERLQGFRDGHTEITWRKKRPEDCPDGPRYRAIGNSKAVPVVRWVGERLLRELSDER